jgi:hypothetical protein
MECAGNRFPAAAAGQLGNEPCSYGELAQASVGVSTWSQAGMWGFAAQLRPRGQLVLLCWCHTWWCHTWWQLLHAIPGNAQHCCG